MFIRDQGLWKEKGGSKMGQWKRLKFTVDLTKPHQHYSEFLPAMWRLQSAWLGQVLKQ